MYVYVFVYACITYVRMHICMYMCIYVCMYICVYVLWMQVCMYVCVTPPAVTRYIAVVQSHNNVFVCSTSFFPVISSADPDIDTMC